MQQLFQLVNRFSTKLYKHCQIELCCQILNGYFLDFVFQQIIDPKICYTNGWFIVSYTVFWLNFFVQKMRSENIVKPIQNSEKKWSDQFHPQLACLKRIVTVPAIINEVRLLGVDFYFLWCFTIIQRPLSSCFCSSLCCSILAEISFAVSLQTEEGYVFL